MRKHYYTLTIPDELKAEGRSKASWNQLLNTHHMRGWNINLSDILSNITHVILYLGFYLKNPPVSLSRLKHYSGENNITLRYKSHRTKKQEDLVMTSDEFITLFASHVPEKWFHMIRYYGFLSPSARMRKMLTEVVVYPLAQQDKKPAKKVTWRNMYQHVFKVNPLACLLCGKKLLFAGMNFGLNRKELMARHHDLACLRWR
ncbi:transposase [Candidatus Arsenophonus triatominarum]|uniref:transposase n=1 Tax=Candidatus Arsenophonus triatominarum TaxID=57911 RepID=UPI000940B54E|nr:transposase [Candidatus Arsenophonus triatominarum]